MGVKATWRYEVKQSLRIITLSFPSFLLFDTEAFESSFNSVSYRLTVVLNQK